MADLQRAEYEVAEGVRPLYKLDAVIAFVGPEVDGYNRAAPEVSEAVGAAIDAAKDALTSRGYVIARTGYGSMRIG